MHRQRSLRALLGGLLGALVVSGCASLPDEGRLREGQGSPEPTRGGIHYVPPGPADDARPGEIVTGFLDAMLASPVQIGTARSYLTPDAAADWHPEAGVVVYDDARQVATDSPARVALTGAAWIDALGRWRGEWQGGSSHIDLPLVREDGRWRLAGAPDALFVRREWFRRHYDPVQLYFLETGGRLVVPEPVFAPRGEQRATALVRSLLATPAPAGTTTRLAGLRLAQGAVTVAGGAARIALTGDPDLPTPASRTQLAAQLAWTLRQVPEIRTFEVRIDDNPLTVEGGVTKIPVSDGASFDPSIVGATTGLFGLLRGRPARLGSDAEPIKGPLGAAYDFREIGVEPLGELGAGVRADGREVRVAPLDTDGGAVTVSGEDFGRPAWDGLGRVWLADRRPTGAVIQVVADGRVRTTTVPGVSGQQAVDLVVSRDGTRLLTAVRRADGAVAVLMNRLTWSGTAVTASAAAQIAVLDGVRDLAWSGQTHLAVLSVAGTAARITWLALDGAPEDLAATPPTDTIFRDVRSLVSSAADGEPAWAVAADGALLGIGSDRRSLSARKLAAITYAG